jgi:mono/diheme cytochrome c family protein
MKHTLLLLVFAFGLVACGGSDAPDSSDAAPSPAAPSVELPVTSVELGPIDAALATEGQGIYETRCTTCHKMEGRYVGPPLGDVVEQREPEWIMNMILAPEKMLQTDPTAQELLAEYSVPMTNQNLSEEEARAILEYLRQVHEGV